VASVRYKIILSFVLCFTDEPLWCDVDNIIRVFIQKQSDYSNVQHVILTLEGDQGPLVL